MTLTIDLENHIHVCLTSILKVIRQGQVIYFGVFEIPDLENVEINTKIKSVTYIQPDIKKVTLNCMFDLNSYGQLSRSRELF